MGDKIWLIPVKSIEEYKPGPRGRHAVQAQKKAAEVKLVEEFNNTVRVAQGRPISEQIDEQQSGQEPDPTEYLSVEETAERLKFARRTIRS